MVVGVDNVQRVYGEPLVVILELEQLRDRAVVVEVVLVLEDDWPVEEPRDGNELVITDENIRASCVHERHVAPGFVENYIFTW